MKKAMIVSVTLLLVAIAAVHVSERSTPAARLADSPFVWFVAIKNDPEASGTSFDAGDNKIEWRSRADSVLVGASPPYWDEFFLVGGDDKEAQPRIPTSVADAYVVRVETVRLPLLLTGTFSMLHTLGIWRMPDETIGDDFSHTGFDVGLGPSPDNVATLKSRPADQKPAMVNFLRYLDVARYTESKVEKTVSGREAYTRYGSVAFKTVYSLGGQLVTAGKIVEVVRGSQAGPTRGD